MNYLQVENLSKSYGEKLLFQGISFGINRGQKVALIAKNGMGKTSLLNIIMGKDIPDEGNVIINKEVRISYLAQNPVFDEELTVLETVLNSNNDFFATIKTYEDALSSLQKNNDVESQQALEKSMIAMDLKNAWDYENKIKEVLSRLQITEMEQKVHSLSGGQRRKLALAKSLIEEVDLLLLDEPTNHLDIDMIEWLEAYLSAQKMTLLMVTHDRYFLDAVCNEIYELEQDNIYYYKGNYQYFITKKAERLLIQDREQERAKNLYRKELEWMRRMPKARTTKSKARIDAFYNLESKAKKIHREQMPEFEVKLSRIGKKILEVNHLHKSFDDKKIIEDFSHTFKRGERIGVVGANGSGKSTFFKLIMGELKPDMGSIVKGQTMVFGYFSQEGIKIKEDKRLIDIVKDVADEIPFGTSSTLSAAQFLQYFNFDHGTSHSYYRNLSGGEKRRLQLMLTFINNPNFLILDEPTNDLDIDTLNVLEEFLSKYQGCLMVTTHDRAFLDRAVDHLFIFEEGAKIKDYHSNYTEYRNLKKLQDKENKKAKLKKKTTEEDTPKLKQKKKVGFKEKRLFELLSRELEELEVKKQVITEKLNAGVGSPDDFMHWSHDFQQLQEDIDAKEMQWLELSELMEE